MMKASLYRYRLPLSQPLQFHDRQISVREGLLRAGHEVLWVEL